MEQDQNNPETESIPVAIESTNDGCQVFDKMPSITSTQHLEIGSDRGWSEEQKMEWIISEPSGKRLLFGFDLPITEENGAVLDTISILAEFPANNFGAYAISITIAPSDVLEFLQRECHGKSLRVVPWFEKPEGSVTYTYEDNERVDVAEEDTDEDEHNFFDINDIDPCIKSVGSNFPYMKRRKKLPDPVEKEKGCFEDLEYSYLLNRAYGWWKRGNNLMRILNVAAFAESAYSSTEGRICKPFNPLLGETYEADFPDKGWKLWGDSNLKNKLWGRSIQLDPVGVLTLEFDNGEVFQWSKVPTSIYNPILGKLYCDHQEKLPPTDSRLRPDQRYLENGEYEMANSEKLRLEQRQRQARKIILFDLQKFLLLMYKSHQFHMPSQTSIVLKAEVLRGIKEIGSVLYWMGLLDIVLRELDTTHFMQTTAWLGLLPSAYGQTLYSQNGGDNPVVNLFKLATAVMVSNPRCPNPTSLYTMSKHAEVVDLLYKANLNTRSVLEYAFVFTSATLDKYCSKWSAAPKSGFIDITTSEDFVVLLSQIRYFDPWGQGSSKGGEIVTVRREDEKHEAKGIRDLENELGIELGIARSELGNFDKEELKGEHVTHMGKLT
ncbi:Oxysterol-binding protein-related protein 2B [Hibiscus syriacus]|uniref:Oxysterol-binding protein-related protein 2B n=1 Tax=Hibiscus syriacus TaxID=106335 RepID=A0A6A2Z717_HIBSY|nr:Oxysterol-binding protein-related protein 2B [Hibiscus syriacus]